MFLNTRSGATSSTSTTELSDLNERRIRRVRLTLRPEEKSNTKNDTNTEEKMVSSSWKKRNGLMQRERPPGRESTEQEKPVTNGFSREQRIQTRAYGNVQSAASNQQEVVARQWSQGPLSDEMRYIREVRDSLEKVRERMYGQFGGMQQSMQKLSQDLRMANSHRRYLESEVRTRRTAMDSFDQMNSSLISANIDLQKSLLENCQSRVGGRDEIKTLRSSLEKTEEKLKDTEKQLTAALGENCSLKRQVETSEEEKSRALKELSAKLQKEKEEQLQEQQTKFREDLEALQTQLDDYIKRLEEAEKNAKIAEAKIAERDQRITEVERLLNCMAQEKGELIQKLCDCEKRLRGLDQTDHVDKAAAKLSEQLKAESAELKERIKHLNDMVFSQQRKVKAMIEEVETLRAKVAQKDMFITELLDRIAIVECENNELEDKLKYFMSVQKAIETKAPTRDIGVGCDLATSVKEPNYVQTVPSIPVTAVPRSSSRLSNSLLRYTPGQYSTILRYSQEHTLETVASSTTTTQVQTEIDDGKSESVETSLTSDLSSTTSSVSRSSPAKVYTPFMRLMEMSAKINID